MWVGGVTEEDRKKEEESRKNNANMGVKISINPMIRLVSDSGSTIYDIFSVNVTYDAALTDRQTKAFMEQQLMMMDQQKDSDLQAHWRMIDEMVHATDKQQSKPSQKNDDVDSTLRSNPFGLGSSGSR